MIVMIARNFIQEGKKGEFVEAVRELICESRKEPGCLSYDLCQDPREENTLIFVERWRDEESIEAHRTAPHFVAAKEAFSLLRTGPSQITMLTDVQE